VYTGISQPIGCFDAQDHDIQLSAQSLNDAAEAYEIIPTTFCTMVKHEKVLNGKIWKKIPMEAFEAFVSTQQTKPF
jgi:cytochrome c551/c552